MGRCVSLIRAGLSRGPGGGVVLASYVLVTAALAFPLVGRLASALPGDGADPVLNAWILWWNTQALPLTDQWWNAPAFHPQARVLTYSEHLLGLMPISAPVYWLTGSPIIAYNVTFLLTFVLSGWTAYLLGFELTGRRDAAWLAGIAYAFAPYRMSHLAHLQVLASFWMPLALVGLHRYARDGRSRWLVWFGAATLMQGLSNSYCLLYFPILVGLWAVWFSRTVGWWRQVGAIAASGLLAMLPLVPILLVYSDAHEAQGLRRGMEEILPLSADLTGLLSVAPYLSVWGSLGLFQNPEQQLFPGLTVVILLGAGLWRMRGWQIADSGSRALRVVRTVAGTLLVLVVTVLVVRMLTGPWSIEPLGVRISVNRLDKIFPQVFVVFLVSVLVSPLGVTAWRRRSPVAFYLLAALVLGLCAMGPYPAVAGTSFMADSPYRLLLQLPGFDALRVPARFWMLVLVCVSALTALAYARVVPPGRRRGAAVLAALAAGMLADGWVRFPTLPAPYRSPLLDARAGTRAAGRLARRRQRRDVEGRRTRATGREWVQWVRARLLRRDGACVRSGAHRRDASRAGRSGRRTTRTDRPDPSRRRFPRKRSGARAAGAIGGRHGHRGGLYVRTHAGRRATRHPGRRATSGSPRDGERIRAPRSLRDRRRTRPAVEQRTPGAGPTAPTRSGRLAPGRCDCSVGQRQHGFSAAAPRGRLARWKRLGYRLAGADRHRDAERRSAGPAGAADRGISCGDCAPCSPAPDGH